LYYDLSFLVFHHDVAFFAVASSVIFIAELVIMKNSISTLNANKYIRATFTCISTSIHHASRTRLHF